MALCADFAVPLMALLAVPMSSVNPRQGRFAKVIPAVLLYLIYSCYKARLNLPVLPVN
ncbi:permease [Actinobacillus equuli]|nr:permease [Actinobacillus equuli]